MWKVAVGGMVSALVLGTMPVTVSVIVLVKKLTARGELKRVSLQTFPLHPILLWCAFKINWITCQQILGVVSP